MTRARRGGMTAAALVLATAAARAQESEWYVHSPYSTTKLAPGGDHLDWLFAQGFHLARGDLEIRADRGILRLDSDEVPDLGGGEGGGLPRRGASPPAERRLMSEALMRERLAAFLRTVKGEAPSTRGTSPFPWGLLQSMYLEGGVSVMQGGRELARADRLYFSTIDDRTVLEGAELRLWSAGPSEGARVLVIRGARLVRQGRRTTGRDVSVTTCDAGVPHFEARLGEVEIIERETDFEIRTRDGDLAFAGVGVLPLPDTRFFTGDQTSFPIQGASVGYSSNEGARAQLDLGASFNPVGGALHEFFTGRPGSEFRGDWHLGLGFNQERGFPLEGGLVYGAPGLYRGRTEAFYLHDEGRDRREIRNQLDGSPIDEDDRSLIHTENRVHLGENTTLDLTVFRLGDPAVWPEFYRGEYREDERPETSAHLRHAVDNRLLTATARVDINGFSYDDDRSLAPSFAEELPLLTFHWFSEQLATLPYDTPLLLTSAGSAGYLQNDFDDTVPGPDDETLRLDEQLELAAPFHVGPIGIRPFAAARATYYDDHVLGDDDTRWAFEAGVSAGTWLGRTWSWAGDGGRRHALRHTAIPTVSYVDRFKVDGDPGDYPQFDATDAVDEGAELRIGLLNRLQHRRGERDPHEFVWLDLAQTITPISERDNDGHHLGLFEYELILRPEEEWIPVPGLRFLLEGEHDWDRGEARTFNVGTRFGKVLGLDWSAGYRTDSNTDGSVFYGLATDLFGRWSLYGRSQYDLEREQTLNYLVRIIRRDHDWRIHLGLEFDEVDNETRVTINFEPTLGGLFKVRNRSYISGAGLEETSYAY